MWTDPSGLKTGQLFKVDFGFEAYKGVGIGFMVSVKVDSDACCDAAGRFHPAWSAGAIKKFSVTAKASVGLGLGVDVRIMGKVKTCVLKIAEIDEDYMVEVRSGCNDPNWCARQCRSRGITIPLGVVQSVSVGSYMIGATFEAGVRGSLKFCYVQGPGCARTGHALGFCGTSRIAAEFTYLFFAWYVEDTMSGCYPLIGTSAMLD